MENSFDFRRAASDASRNFFRSSAYSMIAPASARASRTGTFFPSIPSLTTFPQLGVVITGNP